MCGRYYRKSDKLKIAEHFRARNDLTDLVLPDADYNVAPTTMQPVIREARDTKERELVLMRWGLIPFFSKSLSDVKGISTINARAETIATSGTYREPFKRRRCIVPANGFYEWALSPIAADSDRAEIEAEEEAAVLRLEPKRAHKAKAPGKTPYRFDMAPANPLPSPVSGMHGRNRSGHHKTRTIGCNPSPSSRLSLTNSPPRFIPVCPLSCALVTVTAGLIGRSPTSHQLICYALPR
jgi:putative SOS response-associated peptidase YedK